MPDRVGPHAFTIRHQGPTTTCRVFPDGGDNAGHCFVCDQPIAPSGEPVTLVPIGCAEPDDQAKMRDGRWVSARALVVHAACAGRALWEAGDGR